MPLSQWSDHPHHWENREKILRKKICIFLKISQDEHFNYSPMMIKIYILQFLGKK